MPGPAELHGHDGAFALGDAPPTGWLRLVDDALRGYVYECDVAAGRVERSDGFAAVTGWSVTEAPPTVAWWLDQIHADDVAPLRRALDASTPDVSTPDAATPDARREHVYRARHRDGHWIWIRDRQTVLRDAHGRIVRIVGVAQDVTAQTSGEEARREREAVVAQQLAQLEAVYQHAPIGLCVFDRELRYRRINERLAEWNGIPVAAHLGRTVREIVPDLADALEGFARRVLETGEPVRDLDLSGETAAVPGEVRHWREQWFPLTDDAGTIIGLNVVVEEVTETRRATAALAESEARYRVATEVTELGTWTWDVASDRATFDARVRALFGFEHDDPWPRVQILSARVHPDDRETMMAAFAAAADASGPGRYQAEFRVVRPDGTERWARAAGQMQFAGEGAGRRATVLVGTVLDVTEARAREAAVQAAAAAERRAREAAERAAARLARLQQVAAALSPALSPAEVADVIMDVGFEALGAWGGGIVELAPDGATYEVLRMAGYPEDVADRYRRFPADTPLPAGDVFRTRAPVFVESCDAWVARYGSPPQVAPAGRTVDACAWAALPLLVDGRLLGVLTLCFAERGAFTDDDRRFMTSLAHHCAQALARARAYEAVRASEERFRVVQASSPDGFAILRAVRDAAGRITDFTWIYLNEAAGRTVGHAPDALLGRRLLALHPGHVASGLFDAYARVVETGVPLLQEAQYTAEGLDIFVRLLATRATADDLAISFVDLSDRRRMEIALRASEERLRCVLEAERAARARTERLQAVTSALTGALTPAAVAQVVCEHGTAAFGASTGGMWTLAADEGTLHVAGAVGFPPEVVEAYRLVPLDAPVPVAAIARTGRPIFTADLRSLADDFPAIAGDLRTVGREAWAGVPLRLGARVVGCVVFGFPAARDFSPEDEAFAAALAQQGAQALERAWLFTSEREARTRAETTGRREAQLQRVTATLSSAISLADVARTVISAGRETFGAVAGNVLELVRAPDGVTQLVRVVAAEGYTADVLRAWDGASLDARTPMTEAMREGRVIWYATSAERAARWGAPAPAGFQAGALVPVFLHDRVIGGWSLAFTAPRTFDAEDCAFLITLGRQAALAMERASLFEAERTARVRTERLQTLTAALGTARSVDEVARLALDQGGHATGLTHGTVALLDAAAARFTIVGAVGHAPAALEAWRTFPNAPGLPAHDACAARAPLLLATPDADDARYPAMAAWSRTHGVRGQVLLPLLATPPSNATGTASSVIGLLTFELTAARDVPADELRFLQAIAGVTAQALERVGLTEAEQAARQAAEAASRAKSEFLAVMSHELRTPLNAIGGYTELLELGIRGPVTAEQRADLARIQQSQRHLLGLINQVLNYARVDAGAVEYVLADVSVHEALVSAEALVLPQVQARGLGFACDPVPPAPDGRSLAVRADREKLRQILLNLLSNAVKFTEPGGEVRVSARLDGQCVRLAVRDTGIGIPPEKLAAIFEPFVQVDQRLTRPHEGVGLGLAISRELARGMGGDLTAESTPGAGSTFTLTLHAV